jgi:hypothetical protein
MDARKPEKHFLTLPVDMQSSVLSFLPGSGLARFSTVSQGCRSVATMDCLWRPQLARHFGDVVSTFSLNSMNSARLFRTFATTICNLCRDVLLPATPRLETTRYRKPHTCSQCKRVRCAECHCQCRCLNADCQHTLHQGTFYECERCHGRAHADCDQIFECEDCESSFCVVCMPAMGFMCDVCNTWCCGICRILAGGKCSNCW